MKLRSQILNDCELMLNCIPEFQQTIHILDCHTIPEFIVRRATKKLHIERVRVDEIIRSEILNDCELMLTHHTWRRSRQPR